jgi:hypothetical protein
LARAFLASAARLAAKGSGLVALEACSAQVIPGPQQRAVATTTKAANTKLLVLFPGIVLSHTLSIIALLFLLDLHLDESFLNRLGHLVASTSFARDLAACGLPSFI